jgi:cytochrome P450
VAATGVPVSAPQRYPLLGHLPPFLHDKLGFLSRAARSSGVIRLDIGAPTLLLTEPADIDHVFVAGYRHYIKTRRVTSSRGRRLFGSGVLTSSGERHLDLRRAVQPVFHPRTMERISSSTIATVDEILDGWDPDGEVEALSEAMRLARRGILRALFGPDAEEVDLLDGDLATRQSWIHYLFRSITPYPELVPRSITLSHRRAKRRTDRALVAALRSRGHEPNGVDDLLCALVRGRGGDGTPLTERELLDEARVFTVTGHETVGAGLAWTWYLLAQHPDVQERVQEEVDQVLDGGVPDARDVGRLEYTGRVLAESFRLYPPTWIVVRVAVEPDRLPSGAVVPVGTKLYLSPWVVQRDPRWFPDPERFDPERFAPVSAGQRPEYAYFPFGGGTRLCIGKRFALMECTLAVARTAQRYALELVPGQQVRPDPGIILAPRPGVRLIPRAR